MAKKRAKTTWPDKEGVRNQLFLVWCFLLVLYVSLFLLSSTKTAVDFTQAADAAWKVAYLIVPVLGAFGGFWFADAAEQEEAREQRRVKPQVRNAVFIITGVLHSLVVMYLVIGVLLENFNLPEGGIFYEERVELVLRVLLLVWSVSLLPVGWLLKGQEIPTPNEAPLPARSIDP